MTLVLNIGLGGFSVRKFCKFQFNLKIPTNNIYNVIVVSIIFLIFFVRIKFLIVFFFKKIDLYGEGANHNRQRCSVHDDITKHGDASDNGGPELGCVGKS